jgi:catechol 2,3-dioxygenase-like lactoylglutathione lyase family enzyme
MEHAKHMGGFDHAAIPVNDPETMIRFYGALGFGVPDLVRDAAPVTVLLAGCGPAPRSPRVPRAAC